MKPFDALFYGWVDWSQWYVGSINSWTLLPNNQQVRLLEFGIFPSYTARVLIQLLDFDLQYEAVPLAGRQWSKEVDLILDWYPSETLFFGVALNILKPDQAAQAVFLDDEKVREVVFWLGLTF